MVITAFSRDGSTDSARVRGCQAYAGDTEVMEVANSNPNRLIPHGPAFIYVVLSAPGYLRAASRAKHARHICVLSQ